MFFNKFKFIIEKIFILKKSKYFVKIPLMLNFLGNEIYVESSVMTPKYIYFKIYNDDIDFFPIANSKILIFITLNLYRKGKIEIKGNIIDIENLKGNRSGIWIQFLDITLKQNEIISLFLKHDYMPRFNVRFNSKIIFKSISLDAEAINLSKNGIFIETNPIKEILDPVCKLILYPNKEKIEVDAHLTWVNNGNYYDKPLGYGFKFNHTLESKFKIVKFLDKYSKSFELLR